MPTLVISSDVVLGLPEFPAIDARPIVSVIEFDVPRCVLTYGVAPCQAALGITGTKKCYNSRTTCQDLANYTPELFTFRFTRSSAQIHRDDGNDIIPSVTVVRTTPQLLAPGVNMGQRESVTVTFEDHPHSDAGFDKYLEERPFDPFAQGTFWGKFRSRYRSLRGLPLRIYRGQLGQPFSEFEVWNYIIENAGPTGTGFTITGKDHLKLLDGERAQAPALSLGELAADILAADGSLTLSPVGIGDLDYPASGKIAIGGSEVASFTRVADVMTLTARGLHGTEAADHELGERVQLVLEFIAKPAEQIIYELLTGYTEILPEWITFADWETEVGAYVDQLYGTVLAEPTDVRELINELVEQVGLIIWWDLSAMKVRLVALRPVTSGAQLIDENIRIEGTFRSQEQPKKRASEVWTYFNQRNPLEPVDDPSNYASAVVTLDENADPEEPPAIKKVFSRWIGFGNRAAAQRLNGQLLARFSQPPRLFAFEMFYGTEIPELGRGARITHESLQDDQGAPLEPPVQIIAVENERDGSRIQAEEMIFVPNDDLSGTHLIVIDVDSFNVNLRELHDSFYAAPEPYDVVLCVIDEGVIVGSLTDGLPAFEVGDWPEFVFITLLIRGRIEGKGGDASSVSPFNGEAGSTAFFTRYPLVVDNTDGEIWGGGGAGGGYYVETVFDIFQRGGGGGGAGQIPGTAASSAGTEPPTPAQNGTTENGGAGATGSGGTAGSGGDPGQAGGNGAPIPAPIQIAGTGGAAGVAVDGESFVSYAAEGSILGPRIN
jgi:hypothetical protein